MILGTHDVTLTVEPFVSLQVQPLHYLGFELHPGYLVPLFAFEWGDAELEGVSPRLAGPCVEIDNAIGKITVETAESTDADAGVRIAAVKWVHSRSLLDQIPILIEPTRCGLAVHFKGPKSGYWEIGYAITVPAGTEIGVKQAAGDVRLIDVAATASIELGLGEIVVDGLVGSSLTISAGAGDVHVVDVAAEAIEVELGTGNVAILLPVDASYGVAAEVGIGEIVVGPFPGFEAIEAGGLGGSVEVTLGEGSGSLSVKLGVGEIAVRPAPD